LTGSDHLLFSAAFPYPARRVPVFADNVVATSQPLASQAGVEMLRSGGNAVDAALAAAIALTVVEPTGNGIGSDAFALIWDGRKLHGLNGSGKSPAGWSERYFQHYRDMPLTGWDSVTVPGAVHAWHEISSRFGKLEFATLFEPAICYADKGFLVTPTVAALWAEARETYRQFPEFAKAFLPAGKSPAAGDRFICPGQADTLRQIAATKGRAFYNGELAEKIAACAAGGGGLLTLEDLAAHRSEWVDPVQIRYRGTEVHELPPNGQGMAALIALGLLRHRDIGNYPPDSTDSIHLQVESMKMAFAEAWGHISDPTTMKIDPLSLLDDDFLKNQAAKIRMDRAARPKAAAAREKGTVTLTTADQNGMMVSYIQSNYMGFGSGIVVPGTGISLQNRGAGFFLKAGHPNQVAGGKRPYHTIIPAFATRRGRPVLGFGVMGGIMQPQGHVQMVVRIFDYGLNPQAASDAPRWCLTEDFQLALEPGFGDRVADELQGRGHQLVSDPMPKIFGGAQLIAKLENGYCAASDHRKDGQAVGF
jgi:gamma-glutamyltranspeptidase/glutathione hydrolase